MKNFEGILGHTEDNLVLNDDIKFHIGQQPNTNGYIYSLCNPNESLCSICKIPIIFNKMCKECLTTLTPDELKDLIHYLVIRKLKGR